MSGFPPKIDKIYKPEDSRGSAQLNYKEIDRRYIIIKNWWKKANLRKWQEVAQINKDNRVHCSAEAIQVITHQRIIFKVLKEKMLPQNFKPSENIF